MKKRIFALLCTMTLALSMLTGCGGGSNNTPDDGSSSDSSNSSSLDYPKKNISVIVPYGAGGTTDLTTRALFEAVADDAMPKTSNFVVENIAGGSGLTGTEQAMTAKADGYTLLAVTGDIVLSRAMGATDIVPEEAFIPLVCTQYQSYCLIAKNNSDFDTLEKFIEKVKSGDDVVTVATTGVGTPGGLACIALEQYFGKSIRTVTYDSSANCVVAVASGEVDATFQPATAAIGQVEAGELSFIAVTSKEASPDLPGVPSIAATYPEAADMDLNSVICVCALAGTDQAIVDYLRDILNDALLSDKYAESVSTFLMTPVSMDVEQLESLWPDAYNFYMEYLSK